MFNVCPGCGEYRADKTIQAADPASTRAVAVCPVCGHGHPFLRLPLFILTGPSGAGKSTVTQVLAAQSTNIVVLEADILLGLAPGEHWPTYWDHWLRLAKNIGQSGRPVLLSDSALGVPANVDGLVETRYFSAIHRLALVCDVDVLAARLRARPAWRKSSHHAFVQKHIQFNSWFKEKGPECVPPITLVDTTGKSVDNVVETVREWLNQH